MLLPCHFCACRVSSSAARTRHRRSGTARTRTRIRTATATGTGTGTTTRTRTGSPCSSSSTCTACGASSEARLATGAGPCALGLAPVAGSHEARGSAQCPRRPPAARPLSALRTAPGARPRARERQNRCCKSQFLTLGLRTGATERGRRPRIDRARPVRLAARRCSHLGRPTADRRKLRFTNTVKLKSICVIGGDRGTSPKEMRVYDLSPGRHSRSDPAGRPPAHGAARLRCLCACCLGFVRRGQVCEPGGRGLRGGAGHARHAEVGAGGEPGRGGGVPDPVRGAVPAWRGADADASCRVAGCPSSRRSTRSRCTFPRASAATRRGSPSSASRASGRRPRGRWWSASTRCAACPTRRS